MDERQTQIRERAGYEDALINQDFKEFLQRWSFPVLLGVALIVGGWSARTWWQRTHQQNEDLAFSELEQLRSSESPSPDSLIAVAERYRKHGAVPMMARLTAGDVYLDAVRRGITVGAAPAADGTLTLPEDELAEADRASYLSRAAEQYQAVLDASGQSKDKAIHAIGAMFGLAAVEESRGNVDQAGAWYDRIVTRAQGAGFPQLAELATQRKATAGQLATLAPVPLRAQVPAPLNTAPPPPPAPQAPMPEPQPAQVQLSPSPAPTEPQPAPAGEPR